MRDDIGYLMATDRDRRRKNKADVTNKTSRPIRRKVWCDCMHWLPCLTEMTYISGALILYLLHLLFAFRTFSVYVDGGKHLFWTPLLHTIFTHVYVKAIYTDAAPGILMHICSVIALSLRVLYFPE